MLLKIYIYKGLRGLYIFFVDHHIKAKTFGTHFYYITYKVETTVVEKTLTQLNMQKQRQNNWNIQIGGQFKKIWTKQIKKNYWWNNAVANNASCMGVQHNLHITQPIAQ